jgi:hypothetical protein
MLFDSISIWLLVPQSPISTDRGASVSAGSFSAVHGHLHHADMRFRSLPSRSRLKWQVQLYPAFGYYGMPAMVDSCVSLSIESKVLPSGFILYSRRQTVCEKQQFAE